MGTRSPCLGLALAAELSFAEQAREPCGRGGAEVTDAASLGSRDQRADSGPSDGRSWPVAALPGTRLALAALAIQLLILCLLSSLIYSTFSLTYDFATYYQGVWLIWHGHVDPLSSVLGIPLWSNGGQALFWMLAGITWLARLPILLLWLQDLAIVGTELLVYLWVCDIIRRAPAVSATAATALRIGILALLLINPWTYDAAAFDVHTETFCALPLVALGWALYRGANYWWLAGLTALVLCGGMVQCTYIVGLGVTLLLLGRRRAMLGVALIAAGVAYFLILTSIAGADRLAPFGMTYGYLLSNTPGAATANLPTIVAYLALHPVAALRQLVVERANILADLAAGGVLGIFSRWAVGVAVVVIVANTLSRAFAGVAFQNFPAFEFITVGTAMVAVRWLSTRRRRRLWPLPVLVAIAILAVGYSAVWLPRVVPTWVRVPPSAVAALSRAAELIPPRAQVVVSQGVAGRFAGRPVITTLLKAVPLAVPLETPEVYFLLAPNVGISLMSPSQTEALIAQVMAAGHARVELHRGGVWLLAVRRPYPHARLVLSGGASVVPGWTTPGPAGVAQLQGPQGVSAARSDGRSGYVLSGDYWVTRAGRYMATVRLVVAGTATVEVWNDSSGHLLARRTLVSGTATQVTSLAFRITRGEYARTYSGWGPFVVDPIQPPRGAVVEIRVWVPAGATVSVLSVGVEKLR